MKGTFTPASENLVQPQATHILCKLPEKRLVSAHALVENLAITFSTVGLHSTLQIIINKEMSSFLWL